MLVVCVCVRCVRERVLCVCSLVCESVCRETEKVPIVARLPPPEPSAVSFSGGISPLSSPFVPRPPPPLFSGPWADKPAALQKPPVLAEQTRSRPPRHEQRARGAALRHGDMRGDGDRESRLPAARLAALAQRGAGGVREGMRVKALMHRNEAFSRSLSRLSDDGCAGELARGPVTPDRRTVAASARTQATSAQAGQHAQAVYGRGAAPAGSTAYALRVLHSICEHTPDAA